LLNTDDLKEIAVPFQLDHGQPFPPQVREAVSRVGFQPDEWQTTPFVVILPGLSVGAGLVIAEIAGRSGYLPSIVQMRQVPGSVPPRFEVVAVLNLQSIRDEARLLRFAE
jgi:hypothetical protein